jgi:hypothetical protein
VIGYYVHHHGNGHLHRAITVAPHLPEPVAGISSLPRPDAWVGPWIQLPRDDSAPSYAGADVTAQGLLHWVPVGDAGLSGRMAAISAWIDDHAPSAMVVDQSVEVCLLARLHGVPVVAMTAPGRRTDAAHALGFGIASAVVGAWPAGWSHRMLPGVERDVQAIGAVSRFAVARERPRRAGRRPHAVLIAGTGGDGFSRTSIARAQQQSPGWDWTVLSRTLGTWHADPAAVLATADVAVLHPGQNSLAEVAALRLPAIVVPADRPFAEQRTTASVLADGWPAVVVDGVPDRGWDDLLDEALFLDGEGWAEWCDGGAPTRLANVVSGVVDDDRAA